MTSFAAESITNDMKNLSISDKISIFCFARMNPPHKGHGKLITSMLAIRNSLKTHGIQAHVHIILQERVDPEKNPLTFKQRKDFIWNYINYAPNLEEEDKQYINIRESSTSQHAFQILREEGFNKFYFLMGVDRREDFTSSTFAKYKPNMYNSVVSQGIKWSDLHKESDKENKFFKRGKYNYELQLKEFENDHLLSNYHNMSFPIVSENSIISVINPRPEKAYQLLELGMKEKERDVKTLSATEIREAIRQVPLTTFTGRPIKDIENNDNLKSYEGNKANANFRNLVANLILQGKRGNPKKSKALTFKMIWIIKNQMFPGKEHTIIGYGTRDRTASRTRKASLSEEKKKSSDLMSPIRVLSYNTSWEATQPAVDWMIGPNLYGPPGGENGIGYMCGRRELYDNVEKSGPFEIGVLKDGKTNRCIENIFNIIESGNYDLVGMQEYVHNWPFGDDRHPVFSKKMKKLNHLELVKRELHHGVLDKDIEIGSLYNTNRFELIGEALSEFKIERLNRATGVVETNLDDGRPVQALLLREFNTGKYIIFINAHFPQPRGISVNGSNKDRAKFVSDIMTKLVIRLIKKSGAINKAVNSNNDIILAADTNDGNLDFVNDIVIYGKKMHLGANINTKNTCCTPLVKDIYMKDAGHSSQPSWLTSPYVTWKENETITRDSLRGRKGDVIMYSRDGEFEYVYPEEKKDEPYSDHAPIATTLTAPAQSIGGRRRKTRRKRKRRRRKRTKKKRRRKSRKKKRRHTKKRRRR